MNFEKPKKGIRNLSRQKKKGRIPLIIDVKKCIYIWIDFCRIIKEVLEENMDIRGGYAKPKVTDVLWIQLVFLPYTIALYLIWYCRWVWRFDILREEYGLEEKLYLIRKNLGLSETQFEVRLFFAALLKIRY